MLSFWENTKQKYLPFKYLAPHFLTDPVWTTAALHTLFPLSEKKKQTPTSQSLAILCFAIDLISHPVGAAAPHRQVS